MRIGLYSDLHLEFKRYKGDVIWNIPKTDADVIVLAGDIEAGLHGITWASAQSKRLNKPIIYVAGNHEFYHSTYRTLLQGMRDAANDSGVHFLENETVVFSDTRFIGATLWTDYQANPALSQAKCMENSSRALNDHRVIKVGQKAIFTPEHALRLHQQSRRYIMRKIDEPFDGKTVVVTHHSPSMQPEAQHPRFPVGEITGAFQSNLDDLMDENTIDAWLFGHTHFCCDFKINGTRIVSNQRGYTHENTGSFDEMKVIEI